jgi:putative MATE family efflux protein
MQSTQERSKALDNLIIQGPLWVAIWQLSWPQVLSNSLYSISGFFDIYISGRIGKEAQAAIGMADQLMFLMILLCIALQSGTVALFSRFWGAQDKENAVEAARQSLLLALIFGVCAAVAGLCLAVPLLKLLGASPEVERLGFEFLQIRLLAHIPGILMWITNSIFRARGEARLPMIFNLFVTATIIAGDLFFCLGPLHLGVRGIALAWLVAGTLGSSIALYNLHKSEIGQCFNWSLQGSFKQTVRSTYIWFKRIIVIGLPHCIQDLIWVMSNFCLLLILARTTVPTASQASWGISLQFEELIAVLPIVAIGVAVGTIVGQNLGALNPDRAEKAAWQASGLALLYSIPIGIIMYFGADRFASIMSTDTKVIEYTVSYLRISAPVQPLIAFWVVLTGAMQGAGYTRWPMLAISLSLILVRLPLCWFLTIIMGLGPDGTWLSINASSIVVSALIIWNFKKGYWKLQKV